MHQPGFLDRLLDKTILGGYDCVGYSLRKLAFQKETPLNLNNHVCVVTGANSGLGFATTEALLDMGATVIMVCRNTEKGKAALDRLIKSNRPGKARLEIVDVSSLTELKDLSARIARDFKQIDVLINNAGALNNQRMENEAGIELTFAVNVLAYHACIALLRPLLKQSQGARIINVSSGGMYGSGLRHQDWQYQQDEYDGVLAYAASKRAEVVMTRRYAAELQADNIAIFAMHPGWADTAGVQNALPVFRMLTAPILRNARQGADTIVWLASSKLISLEHTGTFWCDRKIRPEHRMQKTQDSPAIEASLIAECERLTGLSILNLA